MPKKSNDRKALVGTSDHHLELLNAAVSRGARDRTCLRYWSSFIRSRDSYRCVLCRSAHALSAHHIFRKTLLPASRYMTGNGITLCRSCHEEAHWGFNGRPDLTLPMDAEGGEKIEYLAHLYVLLAAAADKRGNPNPKHYFLSEQVLATFKRLQGFSDDYTVSGTPIEQAAAIWRATPINTAKAILNANFPGLFKRSSTLAENMAICREGIFVLESNEGASEELFLKIFF